MQPANGKSENYDVLSWRENSFSV